MTTTTEHSAGGGRVAAAGLTATALLAAAAVAPLPQGGRLESGMLLAFLAFAGVGAVVLRHRSGHPVGRTMLALGLLGLLAGAVQNYGYHAVRARSGQAPGTDLATWFGEVPWALIAALLVVFVLLFPTGAALTRRWTWLVRVVLGCGIGGALLAAVVYWPLRGPQMVTQFEHPEGFLSSVMGFTFMLIGLSFPAAVVSLVLRFRRATGIERAQLKWFLFAAAFLPFLPLEPLLRESFGFTHPVIDLLSGVALIALPLAAGLAVLRYRLYDIDRFISRTLAYGVITALLLGVYGSVILLIAPFAGGGSDLSVAAATLVAAAAFQPVRRRVQAVVDRRFNRSRYDARRTVEGFAARLRHDVDLDDLQDSLGRVIADTVEPASLSVWLRNQAPDLGGGERREPHGSSGDGRAAGLPRNGAGTVRSYP
jgi:hypothetical protein